VAHNPIMAPINDAVNDEVGEYGSKGWLIHHDCMRIDNIE